MMFNINTIAVYIDTVLCIISCTLYTITIQKAEKINQNISVGDESYQWITDRKLYRLVLRLKLGIRLIMALACLVSNVGRIYPVLVAFPKHLLSYSSILFFACMLLDAYIMYLVYSKSDFTFLNILKKNRTMQQRLDEFKKVLANLTPEHLQDASFNTLITWQLSWGDYIIKGGVRPPNAPPH